MPPLPGTVTPYPLAMVICDGVWRDPYTRKITLIGTFSDLGSVDFPFIHPVLTVYVALTDGRGEFPVRIELTDVDEIAKPILNLEQGVEFADQKMTDELVFQASGIQFPRPGEFRLKLYANDEFLTERRIVVFDITQGVADHGE
jgi:hypothetical protein